jgi:hypothetical protein
MSGKAVYNPYTKRPYNVGNTEFLYGIYKTEKFRYIPLSYLKGEMEKGMFDNTKYERNTRIKEYIIQREKEEKVKHEENIGYISFD